MSKLNRALDEITTIRQQLERVDRYRGFRSLAVGLSAAWVVAGAFVQLTWFADGGSAAIVMTWVTVAMLSLLSAAVEIGIRWRLNSSPLERQTTKHLVMQLAPSLLVGTVVTIGVFLADAPASLLPGLWACIYGLGLLNCRHDLPTGSIYAAAYFLIVGGLCLLTTSDDGQIRAWQMVATFGMGQFILAVNLYLKLERSGE